MEDKHDIASTIQHGTDYLRYAGLTEEQIDSLVSLRYFTCPASSKRHLAVEGGLVEHSINVTNNLLEHHVFEHVSSAYKVGMLHDLVKLYNYKPITDAAGLVTGWTRVAAPYPGHGVASVMIAGELGIRLNAEETAAIAWHMGPFACDSDDRRKEFDMAVRRYPREIILTHACDFLASMTEDRADNDSHLYIPGK